MKQLSTKIGIINAPRRGGVDTLNPMLRSLRSQDMSAKAASVGVFSDSVEAPPLTEKVDHLEMRDAGTLNELRSDKYFGASNFARALRWASDAEVVVVSDDDMLMARNWLKRSIQLLVAAHEANIDHPVIALSHFFAELDIFVETPIRTDRDRLYAVSAEGNSNGLFPIVMDADTARALADLVEMEFLRKESDYATLVACRDRGIGSLLYTDPCIAMHMNTASHFLRYMAFERLYVTKRFCPF
jgi:hypothetical protein